MNLYDFRALNNYDQGEAIWNKGVFLGGRFEGIYNIALYDLGGFYVEVYHDGETNQISRIRPFRTTRLLNPYLDGFNNSELENIL